MSTPWFHVTSLPAAGDSIVLDRDEAKHALGVRRLGAGDGVTVFDGRGGIAEATITGERSRDGGPVIRVVSVRRQERRGADVVVGVAPPKGDRLSTMLDMLGQLGVSKVVPLDTQHGVVDADGINRARAERILLESAKQSRGAWVPELGSAMTVREFVASAVAEGREVLIAQPGGVAAQCASGRAALVVGPEGGFSVQEVADAVAAGASAVDLGPAILRVETAAVCLAAQLRARPA
jgi:16S rRNA (uracil1498-N3)-methyltransferase